MRYPKTAKKKFGKHVYSTGTHHSLLNVRKSSKNPNTTYGWRNAEVVGVTSSYNIKER
jgi:hypothetical protein